MDGNVPPDRASEPESWATRLRAVYRDAAEGSRVEREQALRGAMSEVPTVVLERILGALGRRLPSDGFDPEYTERLRAEREALARENRRLRTELDRAQPRPGQAEGGCASVVARLREAYEGKVPKLATKDLATREARLAMLIVELVEFARAQEKSREWLLRFLENPDGSQLTRPSALRAAVKAVLEDEPGSTRSVRKLLRAQRRFLPELIRAFQTALPEGTRGVLGQLEPSALEARNKLFGVDYEATWRGFLRKRSDLLSLTDDELFRIHFLPAIRRALASVEAPEPPSADSTFDG